MVKCATNDISKDTRVKIIWLLYKSVQCLQMWSRVNVFVHRAQSLKERESE